ARRPALKVSFGSFASFSSPPLTSAIRLISDNGGDIAGGLKRAKGRHRECSKDAGCKYFTGSPHRHGRSWQTERLRLMGNRNPPVFQPTRTGYDRDLLGGIFCKRKQSRLTRARRCAGSVSGRFAWRPGSSFSLI